MSAAKLLSCHFIFLLHSDKCATRENTPKKCAEIETRAECLTSIGGNKGIACVWCPDGSCAKKPIKTPQKCIAKEYAKDLGVLDFEDCLQAGTQNGYSGSHYS